MGRFHRLNALDLMSGDMRQLGGKSLAARTNRIKLRVPARDFAAVFPRLRGRLRPGTGGSLRPLLRACALEKCPGVLSCEFM